MVEEKTLPLHELKYYHGESLGFVFSGVLPSSNDAIQRLANNLVGWGVSKKLPEFYVRVTPNEVAFIYAPDSEFKQAAFYQACRQFNVMGIFTIDTLASWLKLH
jgi:hypothetical protein